MEKLVIIGAGIAGLTTGIYGRLNGYDTEIVEMHTLPGGECTAWKRGEYIFDGCIHWLMGSKPGTSLHDIWREVGALDDKIKILAPEVFYQLEMDGKTVKIYRSLDKLEKHLLEVAPADAKLIRELCRDARAMRALEMPTKPMDMMNAADGIKMGAKMLPIMGLLAKYGKITVADYAAQFTDPALRTAITSFMPVQYSATGFLMTLSSLDAGDSGFPEGGSLPFARRMEKRYLELGGSIRYKARVEEITVENGRTTGVRLADGTEIAADCVISCADGYSTLYGMLAGKYLSDEIKALYEDHDTNPIYSTIQVSIGIGCDLTGQPSMVITKPQAPVDAGGITHEVVSLKNYCFDSTMVPAGKSVVTSLLSADFDWWKAKKADPQAYRAEKERVAHEVVAVLEQRYPETRGKVEAVDVATPMTYVRYCDAWRGAWMSFMTTPRQKTRYLPGNLPGLEGFYMAGQWTMPPGGLPGAVMTGRWVIQRLCAKAKRSFITK